MPKLFGQLPCLGDSLTTTPESPDSVHPPPHRILTQRMIDVDGEFRSAPLLLSCRNERRRLCAVMESDHASPQEKIAALSQLELLTNILTALTDSGVDREN
jgi:hypothetical protein